MTVRQGQGAGDPRQTTDRGPFWHLCKHVAVVGQRPSRAQPALHLQRAATCPHVDIDAVPMLDLLAVVLGEGDVVVARQPDERLTEIVEGTATARDSSVRGCCRRKRGRR
jgi:hypothetical protein